MTEEGKPRKKGGATIIDVAERAGVSISTVSRVLNDSAFVESDKVERVQAVIAELGFQPRAAARALAGRRTRVIGLLVPEISGEFFVPMLRGIEAAASEAGYELLIQTARGGTDASASGGARQRLLGEHNSDGLLAFAESPASPLAQELAASSLPAVLLYSEAPEGSGLSSVAVESREGARAAVEHLIVAHGRRRIAFLEGPPGNRDGEERRRGYEEALAAHGLAADPRLVAPGDFSAAVAAASIRGLLAQGIAFDAVFAGDDGAALGVLGALAEAGIRPGADLSVIGFDDQPFAAHAVPPLATVKAPTEEVGAQAVRLLVAQFEGQTPGSLVLPTTLVPRASCGCGDSPNPDPKGRQK